MHADVSCRYSLPVQGCTLSTLKAKSMPVFVQGYTTDSAYFYCVMTHLLPQYDCVTDTSRHKLNRHRPSRFPGQHQHAQGNQGDTHPFPGFRALAQEGKGENGHQYQAEFVYRRHLGGVARLQGSEIAHP